MRHAGQFFIDGAWVSPAGTRRLAVIDPATEAPFAEIAMGDASDVDRAVSAARAAFPAFATTLVKERLDLLRRLLVEYDKRAGEAGEIISREMGAPIGFAHDVQAATGSHHLRAMIDVLEGYEFETARGSTVLRREPIGVCALITSWNWPINQIVCKVAPALAAGCTMILKPSEIAPLSGILWAEVCEAAGVPKGVFNLVNGDGPTVGMALAGNPGVDMISITGSTRAGVAVATVAAPTVKRVHQELGGNPPTSCCRTSTWRRQSPAASCAASATAASHARRRPGCSSAPSTMMRPCGSPNRLPRRCASVPRTTLARTSGRW